MEFGDLKKLLKKRLEVIRDDVMRVSDPEGQLALLKEVSISIDAWRDEHRDRLPAQLRHFLDNYSLDKALDYIESDSSGLRCS